MLSLLYGFLFTLFSLYKKAAIWFWATISTWLATGKLRSLVFFKKNNSSVTYSHSARNIRG